MTLPAAVRTCYGKYSTFDGRASRSEYWFFVLFIAIVIVAGKVAANTLGQAGDRSEGPVLIELAVSIFLAFNILPLMTAGVRRLHDMGAPGGWIVLWLFLQPAGIVWACFPGTAGDNRYGPGPRSEH